MSGDVRRHAVLGFLVAAGRFTEVCSRGASGPFKQRPGPLSDGQERAGRGRHYRSRLPMGACYTRRVTEREVRVSVRVFREPGALLARMAHDVELVLERITARVEQGRVEVVFEPASLRVTGALVDGRLAPELLDASQRREIERNAQSHVLKTDRFPRGSFEGEFDTGPTSVSVRGTLELLGKRQPISFELLRQDEAHVGELTIAPSRWGVAPYRALLGALKLQDKALIRIEVLAAPDGPNPE